METNTEQKKDSMVKELIQPFLDLGKTSRPLLGLNISYVIEGLVYFGIVGLLALFFNEYIKLNDIDAGGIFGCKNADKQQNFGNGICNALRFDEPWRIPAGAYFSAG
ncbi:MAG TPA: hypothetical protein PLD55_04815 [bacterium]|nr:hypothetical protein [bacterium]HOB70282.1 hypothetical protein [bacterium]HOG42894.1 hypothetical protein [bacterium]HPV20060.1 hypothetical protein [bacterium]HPY13855.1 hypothetical protein [bacterium]